jgi:hypothetical protein
MSATFALAALNDFLRVWLVYLYKKFPPLDYAASDCFTVEWMPRLVASRAWQFLIFCSVLANLRFIESHLTINKSCHERRKSCFFRLSRHFFQLRNVKAENVKDANEIQLKVITSNTAK